jgi:outer membrane protein assembly factor BamB
MHSRTPADQRPPTTEWKPAPTLLDRISFAGFMLAVLFLCFVSGALVILADVFPAQAMKDAYRGGMAYADKLSMSQDPLRSDYWKPERTPEKGVTINEAEAYPGYTLYSSGHGSVAYLIALDGTVVQEWSLPFSAIYDPGRSPVKEPMPDSFMHWNRTRLLPNGDLIAMFETYGDTPWGYGLARLDKDSNVVWSYLGQTHHDFDIADDGRIYVLTHEMRNNTYEKLPQITVPRLDDAVTVLSPEGEELKKVVIMDVLAKSPYSGLLDRITWFNQHDFIHTNTVEFIDAEKAAVLPFASEGQVLLSLRDVDALVVLDLDSEEVVWARRGSWMGQHDPDILPNGNILLFDNLGKFTPGGRSRILEIDPVTGNEVWRYEGSGETFFESDARASQERLPNGNTLITEAAGGRLLEVSPDGRIVWEFINPVRATHPDSGGTILPIVSWAQRIPPQTLAPAFRDQLAAREDGRS